MKIFKPSTLVSLGIAIAASLLTQPLRAGTLQTLDITENSSTSLTAILNGDTANPLSVTSNLADSWTIALTGVGAHQLSQNWAEPDVAGFVNAVIFDSNNFPDQLHVISDFGPGFSGLPDGTPEDSIFTLNGAPLDVTFNDNAATSETTTVPDTGPTFSLFGLSLTGLGFLRRKFC